ncbi:Ger(x)C family spore germination protein [Paenibacillus lautus]|uniref:Ger(X)C family spore germination protein n=1 Tax=Paenibacillus lautus TaxID=1401 RepID=A0A385TJ82_PAELA|nr:Ger(x)C family spore germination protein [Paenibacillus lautus]AYB44560.1 Ger(x)C family spore germination protein [Paenibacillus lautus]MBY0162184.1 Ger(x)C family spore germination protein [Cytobacillus firmus]
MNRKLNLLILIVTASLLLNGCWDSQELNSLSIVSATSIDRSEDEWVISFQVVIPQSIATQTGGGSGGSQSPITIFSTRGKTIREAMQNANLEAPRALFFAHNSVLIINEQVVRNEGVQQILDFFLRPVESRETMSVLLTKGKASNLLEVLIPLEKITGNAIQRVITQGQENLSQVKNMKLIDFASMVANPYQSAMAPELRVSGDQEEQSTLDALKSTRNKAVIKLGDLGVFRGDKLVGWMKRKESRGVAWLSNSVKNLIIVTPCSDRDTNLLSSYRVIQSSTRVDPKLVNGSVNLMVHIQTKGALDETSCTMDLTKPEVITNLEDTIAEQIQEEIYASWKRMKDLNVDVVGFLDMIHRRYPAAGKRLSKLEQPLQELELDLNIEVTVEHTNMINKPFSNLIESNK